jgi:catechol-2,3-dioxygenase
MPRLSNLLECSLYVADLDRSAMFYRRIFSFELVLQDDRMIGLGVPGGSRGNR